MLTHSRAAKPLSKPAGNSLLRGSIPIRNQKNSEDDSPSRPAKRPKVKFDSDIKVKVIEEWDKEPQLIQEAVRCALERHTLGDSSGYLHLKDVYTSKKKAEDEPSTATLRSYTIALLGNVSSLNRSRSDLVHAVLNSQWLGRHDSYVTLYMRFLANLVSTQVVFLVDVLQMLVDNLTFGTSNH